MTKEGKYETAYAIFTPTGDQAEYAICSPIVDEYGTLYFKNDSAHLMAFGSQIEKLEVTKMPDKTAYKEGSEFDPAGMVVTATYANGKTRDVTKYVSYDHTTITSDDKTITISFNHVMYHNEENGTSMTSGIETKTPVTTIDLTIEEESPESGFKMGDVNGDGVIDTIDASSIISYYYGKIELTEEQRTLADVDKDGVIDTIDASRIISFYYGKITQF